MVRGGHGVLTR